MPSPAREQGWRRAKIVERAWVRVAREAVGPEGQVVPQQWLAHTTAPGVPSDDPLGDHRAACATSLSVLSPGSALFSRLRSEAAGVPSLQLSSGSSSFLPRELRVRTLLFGQLCERPMCFVGVALSLSRRSEPSPAPCSSFPSTPSPLPPESRLCMRSCKTSAGSRSAAMETQGQRQAQSAT